MLEADSFPWESASAFALAFAFAFLSVIPAGNLLLLLPLLSPAGTIR
jgi:hypothetical protein